jgi:hypothetical protein
VQRVGFLGFATRSRMSQIGHAGCRSHSNKAAGNSPKTDVRQFTRRAVAAERDARSTAIPAARLQQIAQRFTRLLLWHVRYRWVFWFRADRVRAIRHSRVFGLRTDGARVFGLWSDCG